MALLLAESFDGIDANGLFSKFNFNNIPAWVITFPIGVTGNCLDLSKTSTAGFSIPIKTGNKTIILGCDILTPSGNNGDLITAGSDNGTNTEDFELDVSSNVVTVRTAQTNRSPTYNITHSAWVNIEIKCTKHNSTGSIEIRENGVAVFSQSGIDTEFVDDVFNYIRFNVPSSGSLKIDNLYICDGTGADNNDFLDQVVIETLYPNGDGASSDFLGSDADKINNWQLVDEHVPDVDYVASATVNEQDLYEYEDTALTGTIKGCVLSSLVKLEPSGNKEFAHLARIGASVYEGSNKLVFDNSDQLLEQIYENNPGTGIAWTQAAVNAAQFGLKVKV